MRMKDVLKLLAADLGYRQGGIRLLRGGSLRIDTYDIWIAGKPAETGHQDYEMTRFRARILSTRVKTGGDIVYLYYGGVYDGCLPRPLAAFRMGVQLPCPIHLTSFEPAAYWRFPTDDYTRYDLPAVK